MATEHWVGLRLDPLDTLFFRDGRPFDAATRASGGLPQPQTLAGALRTALLARAGFDFGKFARERKNTELMMALRNSGSADCQPIFDASFRGPWLALAESDNTVSPLLPMPEVLKRAKKDAGKRWSVAKPVASVPGWDDPDGLKPLWRDIPPDPKAEPELLTVAGLKAFLKDPSADLLDADCVKRETLFGYDHRVGIEVDKDTLTSANGMLYVISLLSMQREYEGKPVCLYAEIDMAVEQRYFDDLVIPFGGEGKYVRVTTVTKQEWPTATAGRAMWYLATPTFFPPTGRPLPTVAGLTAAASGAGVPVSGWDVARNGPRATRFAVPAGACYFVNSPATPDDYLDLGIESAALRQEGWGLALPGTWDGKLENPTQ